MHQRQQSVSRQKGSSGRIPTTSSFLFYKQGVPHLVMAHSAFGTGHWHTEHGTLEIRYQHSIFQHRTRECV